MGLVLGCSTNLADGRPNPYFVHRIEAATALYAEGVVAYLLVSGDNGTRDYDEPTMIKAALVERGVPAHRIVLDYAGFRTLDSVIRAREVFGIDDFVVVSQRFHCERAVLLARRLGMHATGYAASDVPGIEGAKRVPASGSRAEGGDRSERWDPAPVSRAEGRHRGGGRLRAD